MNPYNRPGWPNPQVMFKLPELAIKCLTTGDMIQLVSTSTLTFAVDYTFPPNEGTEVVIYDFELYSNGKATGIRDRAKVFPGTVIYHEPRTITARPRRLDWTGGTARIRITFEDIIEERVPRTITGEPRKFEMGGGTSRIKITFEDVVQEMDPRTLIANPREVNWTGGTTRTEVGFEDVFETFEPESITADPREVEWSGGTSKIQVE